MAETVEKSKLQVAPIVTHDEGVLKKDNEIILKSSFDNLGLWATVKRFWKAVLVCNLLCIAAGADGYQTVLNGNVIANQGFINHIGVPGPNNTFVLNAQHTALWGAMQSLGQFIGMVFLNPISDRIGRKMTLYMLWIIIAGSVTIETLARNWKDWAAAKLLAGIGVGCIQATLPIYVTEWSPANIRGAMILAYGFWNRIGSFLSPLVLTLIQDSQPLNYKIPILTQWGFVGIMLPIFLWVPETPAYYAERDYDEKGKASLRRVYGNVEGYDVELEYAIIKNTILEERRRLHSLGLNDTGLKHLVRSYVECFQGPNKWRTLGAALPVCAQQLTGLSFLNTYASLFFKQSGFKNPFLITTILSMLQPHAFGRRMVVVTAAGICTLTMLIVGILGFVPKTTPLTNFLIFVACVWSFFNVALGSLGWAFVGEVASQKLRARTAGLAAGCSVIFGLTFNTSLPIMLDVKGANWGYKTAFLFLGTGVIVFILAYFYVPEPSQRNSAELDELYEKGVPAWRMRSYVTDVQKLQRHNLGLVDGEEKN
ncbi:general substrate transporter [Trichoderma barbatum]